MWVSLLLITVFLIWAVLIWRAAPPLISEKELTSEDFRYCYTTTPLRRTLIMLGSCLLFAFTLWLMSYATTYLIWRELLAAIVDKGSFFFYLLLMVVVVVILVVSHLPKLKRFLIEVCVFFQRCQFFPILPSPKEESLMEQIANLPVGTLPQEITSVLNQGSMREFHVSHVYDQYRRLEVVYRGLQSLAKERKGFIRRFYFGSEWELIDNQFKAIDRQMHANNSDADEALAKKIHTCLFYCYGLLTRVIMETTTSVEESRELFRYYGFEVEVGE